MDKKQSKKSAKRPSYGEKKRHFRGNKYTLEQNTEFVSTSAQKLKHNNDFEVAYDDTFSYSLLSFSLVFTALQSLVKCKVCSGEVQFLKQSPQGLGFKIVVKCSCREFKINSCPMIKNAYEINRRFCFAMRLLGVGLSGIQVFCSVMELEKMSKSTFYSILKHIHIAVKAVSETVFKKAVNEEKQKNVENGFPEDEITVSGDGSWTKRGFTSLLGIVSLIGKYSNKIVDVIVKSKVCKACEKWSGKEKTDEYLLWYEEHKDSCTANHEGSSGKMEVDGIIEMFKRSVPQFDVKYKRYIGDGDSKTFTNLLQADPYDGNPKVEKKECVLHVKKRMYRRVKEGKKLLTQFSKAKKQFQKVNNKETEEHEAVPAKRRKMKRDSSVKSVPAKVKTLSLTNKLMIKLSTYYGLAILRNSDSVEEMNKAVWATFFHLSSTDKNPQHSYCPQGLTSWCEYKKFKAQNQQGTFTHPPAFDDDTATILKPIYEELSSNDLLERCLGKNNQNNNESFNHCVWNLAPKHIFVGKMTLEIATLTAACVFNEGFMLVLKIMETMGVTIGPKGMAYAQIYKDCRIKNAEKSTSDAAKLARSSRRSEKVAENEVFEETEGLLYAPGIAD